MRAARALWRGVVPALLVLPLLAAACRGQGRERDEARLRASIDELLPRIEALSGLAAKKVGITHDPAGPLLEGR